MSACDLVTPKRTSDERVELDLPRMVMRGGLPRLIDIALGNIGAELVGN
jgi:hypothetical protein